MTCICHMQFDLFEIVERAPTSSQTLIESPSVLSVLDNQPSLPCSALVEGRVLLSQVLQENLWVQWGPCDSLHQLLAVCMEGARLVDVFVQPLLEGCKVPLGNVRVKVRQLGPCSLQKSRTELLEYLWGMVS